MTYASFQEQPAGEEVTIAAEGEVQAEVEAEADPAQVALVVAKRQAPELTADCMVYRYGTLAASVDVIRKSTQLPRQFICSILRLKGTI